MRCYLRYTLRTDTGATVFLNNPSIYVLETLAWAAKIPVAGSQLALHPLACSSGPARCVDLVATARRQIWTPPRGAHEVQRSA